MNDIRVRLMYLSLVVKQLVLSTILALLPTNSIWIYLEIAMTTMFVRNRIGSSEVDMVQFFRIVNNDYDERHVELPSNTYSLIWCDEYLDKERKFITGRHTVRDVIKDDFLLVVNMTRVIDSMLVNLPPILKFRLGICSEPKREIVRNNIIDCLGRKFEVSNLFW